MGWMNDTLNYLSRDPVYRQYHQNELTFSLVYAFSENYILPLSHDEVVHGKGSLLGKMPGDDWRRFAGLRALLAYMWAHPGKQLLFMGSEFGQGAEWSEERGLDWWVLGDPDGYHVGVQQMVSDMNGFYRSSPALWALDTSPEGFSWIDANDAAGNTLSFLRFATPLATEPAAVPVPSWLGGGQAVESDGAAAAGEVAAVDEAAGAAGVAEPSVTEVETGGSGASGASGASTVVCVANFSGGPHENYKIGLPHAGRWVEVLNTDAANYGGSGVGNLGAVEAVEEEWHGRPASAVITVPPLAVLWLAPESGS
jgi:1,4-alpha-glucan branching enzyme